MFLDRSCWCSDSGFRNFGWKVCRFFTRLSASPLDIIVEKAWSEQASAAQVLQDPKPKPKAHPRTDPNRPRRASIPGNRRSPRGTDAGSTWNVAVRTTGKLSSCGLWSCSRALGMGCEQFLLRARPSLGDGALPNHFSNNLLMSI